jgi:hypothetical protein
MEAPPGFEPGMEVLQISLGFRSCRFVLPSGRCRMPMFDGVWAVMVSNLSRLSSRIRLTLCTSDGVHPLSNTTGRMRSNTLVAAACNQRYLQLWSGAA